MPKQIPIIQKPNSSYLRKFLMRCKQPKEYARLFLKGKII